jgi:hypothetical protein
MKRELAEMIVYLWSTHAKLRDPETGPYFLLSESFRRNPTPTLKSDLYEYTYL